MPSEPERTRRLASEDPGRADSQALVPCREAKRVERDARLACELAADDPALYEHRRVVRAEADGLAQFLEVSGGGDASVYERLHVARDEARLLVGELRRARKVRRGGGEVCHVAEREDFRSAPHLKSRRDDDESLPRLLDIESVNERVDSHARSPDDSLGLYRLSLARVLERDAVGPNLHDARVGVDFDALLVQNFFDCPAKVVAHAWDELLTHLDDDDARLASESAPAEGVAQKVCHLRRKLDAGSAAA